MPRKTEVFRLLSGLRDSERGRGMRFTPSIFSKLLEPIKRRQFETLVARHAGDAYVKSFPSWNHLLALVYAQFSSAVSLRGLEAGWNVTIWAPVRWCARRCPMRTNGDRLVSLLRPSACWQASWIGRRGTTVRRW